MSEKIIRKKLPDSILIPPVESIMQAESFAVITVTLDKKTGKVQATFDRYIKPELTEAFKSASRMLAEHNYDFQKLILNK